MSPSLAPFDQLCRWLGHTEEYLQLGRFTLDTTLHRRDDGWMVSGERGWRRLPNHPFLDRLVAWFEAHEPNGPLTLEPFVQRATDPQAVAMAWQALRALRDAGALIPALRIPSGCSPAVLHQLVGDLPTSARAAWCTALARLEVLCSEMTNTFDTLDGQTLAELSESANAIVAELYRALDAPGAPRYRSSGLGALRVDRGAPFRASWNERARGSVADALSELLEIWAADGTAEYYRQRHLEFLGAGGFVDEMWRWTTMPAAISAIAPGSDEPLATARPTTRGDVFARHFGAFEELGVDERWALLRPDGTGRVVARPGALVGPWSSVLGEQPRCGAHLVSFDGEGLHLEWGRPQPALFAGRHHQLPVAAAIVAEFAADVARDGLQLAELLDVDVLDIDAAQRHHNGDTVDLGDRGCLRRARLERPDEPSLLSVVNLDGRRVFATSHSAAGSAPASVLGLLRRELVNANGWELLSFGLPLTIAECTATEPLPAVVSESGQVLRRRRLVADPVWVDRVAALEPAARYLEWVQLLSRADLGELVEAHVGDAPVLLVPASSPLAVEALFASLGGPAEVLVVAEPPPATMVFDDAGQRYVAELAVSWWRS